MRLFLHTIELEDQSLWDRALKEAEYVNREHHRHRTPLHRHNKKYTFTWDDSSKRLLGRESQKPSRAVSTASRPSAAEFTAHLSVE